MEMQLQPPPSRRENMSSPLNPIASARGGREATKNPPAQTPRKAAMVLHQHRHRRTNPMIWLGGMCCLVFSLVLIFFGIATVIVYLVIKPRTPLFDITNASLSTVYIDSPPAYLNGDFALVANFTNPNRKIEVEFEYVRIELYFSEKLIAAQGVGAFEQRRGETRLETVQLISSSVYLPQGVASKLQRQVESNRIGYQIRGRFRVKASLAGGMAHFTYWLYGKCELEITAPPYGLLLFRSCRTIR